MRRGQIWISAALYLALGIILISIILSVGLPFIDKIKTRNTVLQTKDVLFSMDKVVREVNLEGKGSRRPIFIEIEEGEFIIDNTNDVITWSLLSEDRLGIEPGVNIKEGNLGIRSTQLGQGYNIQLSLDFGSDGIDIEAVSSVRTVSGAYNLVVEHGNSDEVVIKESGA